MSEYRRAYVNGGTFFFTVVTYRRQPILGHEPAIGLLRRAFKLAMTEYPFHIDAMVILPDHLHCIWTLPDNDCAFSERWRRIKAIFSRNYTGSIREDTSESMHRRDERGIWQRRFWEHLIRDEDDLNRHRDYIHYNPVKHGLTDSPVQWEHSSFRRFVEEGLYAEGWGQTPIKDLVEMNLE